MEDRNSDNHDVTESNNEAHISLIIEEYDVLKTIGKGQEFLPMLTLTLVFHPYISLNIPSQVLLPACVSACTSLLPSILP